MKSASQSFIQPSVSASPVNAEGLLVDGELDEVVGGSGNFITRAVQRAVAIFRSISGVGYRRTTPF